MPHRHPRHDVGRGLLLGMLGVRAVGRDQVLLVGDVDVPRDDAELALGVEDLDGDLDDSAALVDAGDLPRLPPALALDVDEGADLGEGRRDEREREDGVQWGAV